MASRYSRSAQERIGFHLSSERLNTRASHIQCCPRQPRWILFFLKSPAKRERNATSLALERISSGNLFYKTVSHYWLALAPGSQGHQYSNRRRGSHILIDWREHLRASIASSKKFRSTRWLIPAGGFWDAVFTDCHRPAAVNQRNKKRNGPTAP